MKKYNLIVTTPISHLDGIFKLLKNNFNLTYLEDPTEDYLVKNIKKFHAIFTNPNQSKFFLGKKNTIKCYKFKNNCNRIYRIKSYRSKIY